MLVGGSEVSFLGSYNGLGCTVIVVVVNALENINKIVKIILKKNVVFLSAAQDKKIIKMMMKKKKNRVVQSVAQKNRKSNIKYKEDQI